jgi:hypothetical protein
MGGFVSAAQGVPLRNTDSNTDGSGDKYPDRGPYNRIAKGALLLLCCGLLGAFGITRIYRLNESADSQCCKANNERCQAFIIGVALIIGWSAGIYGTILFLSALNDLTSADRRSEDIRIHAVVIPELKFRDVQRHIFSTNFGSCRQYRV